MANINISDRREQRKFGVVMAAAFVVLACIRWWLKGYTPVMLFGVAGAFLVLAIVGPRALKPVFAAWLKFAEALNWVVTRVALIAVFMLLIVPTRLVLRVFGKDPLNRRWLPDASTYWEDAEEQPDEFERYLNQF